MELNDTYLSRSNRLSTVPAKRRTEDKYTKLVVKIAHIVPIGILFCASAKSPERFDPAIIPVQRRYTHAERERDRHVTMVLLVQLDV